MYYTNRKKTDVGTKSEYDYDEFSQTYGEGLLF